MAGLFAWIKNNAEVISALASVAVILVWLAYFQLIYSRYSHQRRPRIYIQQYHGFGLDSACQLLNMSHRYIDVLCVILVAHTATGSFSRSLADHTNWRPETDAADAKQQTSQQGALFPRHAIPLGSFRELLREAAQALPNTFQGQAEEPNRDPAEAVDMLELRVVAMFGDEDLPIGAYRQFALRRNGEATRVHPKTIHTVQLTSRSERRRAEGWFEDCLER